MRHEDVSCTQIQTPTASRRTTSNKRKGPKCPLPSPFPSASLYTVLMSGYYRDNRKGQQPFRGNYGRSHPGYHTDPERDQERGGNWPQPSPNTGSWEQQWQDEQAQSLFATPHTHTTSTTPNPTRASWNPPRGATALKSQIFEESTRGRGTTRKSQGS